MLDFLVVKLLEEKRQYKDINIPCDMEEKKRLFRSLVNVRPAVPIGNDFLRVQDEYLQDELSEKGIVDRADLTVAEQNLYVWQGDITRLKVDAIVNAANSAMLGCFMPCYGCIDNQIHTCAGIQLRLECAEQMKRQGHEELTGSVKITCAYNLPSSYILHTVGPIIQEMPTKLQCEQLANCYRSCMEVADSYDLKSIAFCCISTGEFHFPNRQAAEIAMQTVHDCLQSAKSIETVIFNVFKEVDYAIYTDLLAKNR